MSVARARARHEFASRRPQPRAACSPSSAQAGARRERRACRPRIGRRKRDGQDDARGLAADAGQASSASRSAEPCRRVVRRGRARAATMLCAFIRKKPHDLTICSTSAWSALANAAGIGIAREQMRRRLFTRASVHWADSITAINNVNGDSYSSAVSAPGYVALRIVELAQRQLRVTLRLGNGMRACPASWPRRCTRSWFDGVPRLPAPYVNVTEGDRFSPPAALSPSTSRSVIGVEDPDEDRRVQPTAVDHVDRQILVRVRAAVERERHHVGGVVGIDLTRRQRQRVPPPRAKKPMPACAIDCVTPSWNVG